MTDTPTLLKSIPEQTKTVGMEHYKRRRWLSISSLNNFARCPFKFFLSSGCRLSTKSMQLALTFGSAMHAGLGHIVDGHDVSVALKEFNKVWKDNDSVGDTKRNSLRAALMFSSFAGNVRATYRAAPKANVESVLPRRNSDYEVPFAIDLGIHRILPNGMKEMVPLVGWIDQIVQSIYDSKISPAEFKTTSELSSRFLTGFDASPQLLAYSLAMRIMGYKVERAFLTGLRVSEKNIETISHPVSITNLKLDLFIDWARFIGNSILAHEDAQYFPKDLSACYPYSQFGCQGYQCDFSTMCHNVADWRQLQSMYDIREEQDFILLGE